MSFKSNIILHRFIVLILYLYFYGCYVIVTFPFLAYLLGIFNTILTAIFGAKTSVFKTLINNYVNSVFVVWSECM